MAPIHPAPPAPWIGAPLIETYGEIATVGSAAAPFVERFACGSLRANRKGAAVALLSRAQFERRLTQHLDKIKPGCAGEAVGRIRVGIDPRSHVADTRGPHDVRQLSDVMDECAAAIAKLAESVKDD